MTSSPPKRPEEDTPHKGQRDKGLERDNGGMQEQKQTQRVQLLQFFFQLLQHDFENKPHFIKTLFVFHEKSGFLEIL